jgi:hypothetical protein
MFSSSLGTKRTHDRIESTTHADHGQVSSDVQDDTVCEAIMIPLTRKYATYLKMWETMLCSSHLFAVDTRTEPGHPVRVSLTFMVTDCHGFSSLQCAITGCRYKCLLPRPPTSSLSSMWFKIQGDTFVARVKDLLKQDPSDPKMTMAGVDMRPVLALYMTKSGTIGLSWYVPCSRSFQHMTPVERGDDRIRCYPEIKRPAVPNDNVCSFRMPASEWTKHVGWMSVMSGPHRTRMSWLIDPTYQTLNLSFQQNMSLTVLSMTYTPSTDIPSHRKDLAWIHRPVHSHAGTWLIDIMKRFHMLFSLVDDLECYCSHSNWMMFGSSASATLDISIFLPDMSDVDLAQYA